MLNGIGQRGKNDIVGFLRAASTNNLNVFFQIRTALQCLTWALRHHCIDQEDNDCMTNCIYPFLSAAAVRLF